MDIEFVTVQALCDFMGARSDDHASRVVAAVNARLATYSWLVTDDGQPTAPALQGAMMWAGRLYRRKNSLGGLEMVGDTAAYINRWDPDIADMLSLGAYAIPVVG